MFINFGKKIEGQLLIESLIGISIVTVGLLGIVGLVSRSLSLNRVISDQFTASYLSLEGIEIVRNLLDANIQQGKVWNSGFSNNDPNISYEVDYKSQSLEVANRRLRLHNGFYDYDQESFVTPFKRTIKEVNSGDEIKVNSIVEWTTRGGGVSMVDTEHHFYNWRP